MRNGIYATCNLITKTWEITHDKILLGAGNLIINIIKDTSDESQAAVRLGYSFEDISSAISANLSAISRSLGTDFPWLNIS